MTEELLEGDSLGCAIQMMSMDWRFGQMMALSDQLFGLGAKRLTFAGGLQEEEISLSPVEQVEPSSSEIVFVDFIPVIPMGFPRIVTFVDPSERPLECSNKVILYPMDEQEGSPKSSFETLEEK